jgi:hypothetical protein
MCPAERQTPESDREEQVDERLPAAEVEGNEDDGPEIERGVELSGRLEEGELGDDERAGERDQEAGRAVSSS